MSKFRIREGTENDFIISTETPELTLSIDLHVNTKYHNLGFSHKGQKKEQLVGMNQNIGNERAWINVKLHITKKRNENDSSIDLQENVSITYTPTKVLSTFQPNNKKKNSQNNPNKI